MQAENFLSRFRRRQDAAVLCGGDRIDVQLLALEAGCAALLLTGDIVPDELVLAKAADRDIALLLLRQDTFAAAGAVRTVMDALTHAVECYVTLAANEATDAVAIRAIQLVGRHLRRAVAYGEDIVAREGMCPDCRYPACGFGKS